MTLPPPAAAPSAGAPRLIPTAGAIGTVVSDGESPTYELVRVKLKAECDVRPNTLVRVALQRSDHVLVGRVRSGHEHNPHESAESVNVRDALQLEPRYPVEADSTIIYRAVAVDLLAEIIPGADDRVQAPSTLPEAGAAVFLAGPDDVRDVLGLTSDRERGLYIGDTVGGTASPVILKREAIQRHVFIGGTTGSGKSYAMTVLAEELVDRGVPVIFLDTQDEYRDFVTKLNGRVVTPGVDFNVRLSSLTAAELIDLIPNVPNSEAQSRVVEEAFEELQDELKRGDRRKFVLADLLTYMQKVGPRLTRQDSVDQAVSRTGRIARYQIFGEDVERANWPVWMSPCLSIACKGFRSRQLQIIATALLREFEGLRMREEIPPYVFVLDEAHLFAPEGGSTPCKQVIRETVRIGRHHGIGMVLLTQSPVDIDRSAIRQCNTRLVFALEPDQLEAIRGVRSDATDEMLRALPKMPRGTCLLSGTYESVKHAIPVKIRERRTADVAGGADYPMFTKLAEEWSARLEELRRKAAEKHAR